jgi:hypothetical protein
MPREIVVSPPGDLMWPALFRPRVQNKGKSDEKEAWQVDMLLPMCDAGAQAFVNYLRKLFTDSHGAQARPGGKGLPYKRFVDQTGKETDLWIVKFAKNTVTARGTVLSAPVVTDSQGNPWPEELLIGNGSTGKIAFDYYPWDNEGGKGISLQVEAVRVLDFKHYVPPQATAVFGDPEPGFILPNAGQAVDGFASGGWGPSDPGSTPSVEEVSW